MKIPNNALTLWRNDPELSSLRARLAAVPVERQAADRELQQAAATIAELEGNLHGLEARAEFRKKGALDAERASARAALDQAKATQAAAEQRVRRLAGAERGLQEAIDDRAVELQRPIAVALVAEAETLEREIVDALIAVSPKLVRLGRLRAMADADFRSGVAGERSLAHYIGRPVRFGLLADRFAQLPARLAEVLHHWRRDDPTVPAFDPKAAA